jgi:TRAP-type transport system periplasmic protein
MLRRTVLKNTSTLAASLVGAALLVLPQMSQAQVVLTMSSWVPASHLLTRGLAAWGVEVEKATNGRVKLQMLPKHPAAATGTFDAVRDGLVDVSYVTASYTPARHLLPLMAELPGAGATSEINSVAYNRIHWKHLDKAGEYKGVKLLGVFTHGPGQMFNTKKVIDGPEDFQGMKLRTGGGVADQMARALGAAAFVKPAPESYELLSSGVADGVFFPLESVVSFKLDKIVKHATIFQGGFYSSAFGFFFNEAAWAKIPKQDQDIITGMGGEKLARFFGKYWDEGDRVGMEALKAAGVTITPATPQLLKATSDKAKVLEADWIKAVAAKGIDGAKVLAEFRDELKKVAAGQ